MGHPFSSPNGDEETLNQQFSGYLQYSLQIGTEILDRINDSHAVDFSDDVRVVANQDSPIPRNTKGGIDREIDWVLGDDQHLVGYESKYGDSLSKNQLQDELDKLRLNAEGRDVSLVAVTPHTTQPSILEEFEDESVYWLSWMTVSRRLQQTNEDNLPAEQRPLLRILQDLFEAEDMHPFTGFDHQDKLQYRYFIRDLRQELADSPLKHPGKLNSSTTKQSEPSSWKRIVPKRLDIPFVDESRDSDWKRQTSYFTVSVDTETHDVHAGIVLNVRNIETHRDYVADTVDDLVEYAGDHDLQMWASMNSFNQWELGVAQTDTPEEMSQWLRSGTHEDVRANGTDYKNAHP